MKIINFINPDITVDEYKLLVHCVFSGFGYKDTKFYMNREGFYLPEDQFNAFKSCCDIMIDLDIGTRQEEVNGENFKTYEDVIDHFWENTPCHKYPYGDGIGLYSKGEDLGGVIEVQDNGVINIWSGLGFEEYQFKTKAKNPQHAYMIIKLLTSGVEWEVGGDE